MKNNIKLLFLGALCTAVFTGCEENTELPAHPTYKAVEDFNEGADNTLLVIDGWKNYASAGSTLWKQQVFHDDGYAEFNPFGSGDASNIGWLISPMVELAENNSDFLRFKASQSFLTSADNKLEVFVSTDYDGTNVEAATWVALNPNVPVSSLPYFQYVDSGELPLSAFSGQAYIAFKVTGSGTNTALDGAYQVDSFRLYTK
jgi:hypothetical protein